MTLVMALVGAAWAPPVLADHGVCIIEADVSVPDGAPVYVAIHLTPGNGGTFLIDYDQYGVFDTDSDGWIRFTVAGDDVPYGPAAVHFAITARDFCPDGTMTVSLNPPDTATAPAREQSWIWLLPVLAGLATLTLVMAGGTRRRLPFAG